MTTFSIGESIETPQPLNKNKHVKLKKQLSCLAVSVISYDVLRNLEAESKRKIFYDLDVIWTLNLLIWSQTRQHWATKSRDKFLRVFMQRGFRILSCNSRLRKQHFNTMFFEWDYFFQPSMLSYKPSFLV